MAKKSLGREEDIQSTKKAMESAPSWFLSIPEQKTPWYFIDLTYVDGFVHWYDVGGQGRRIVCGGGLAGKGFDPDNCPICGQVLALYQEAKALRDEGHTAKADKLKNKANRMHGKAEVQFKAIRGQRVLIKTKTGKVWSADWDTEDADSNVAAGIISLSEAQFAGLTGMIKGENTPFIQAGDDLGNRVLWTAKERRKGNSGDKYSAVVWDADEDESEMPDVEIPQELLDIDLEDNFRVDVDELSKVYDLLTGSQSEETAEDEEVELESDSTKEPDNSYLDDVPDDEDDDEDEDAAEEEFEDDIPYDEDDEEEAPKKSPKTQAPSKPKHTASKSPAKRSGKTRL